MKKAELIAQLEGVKVLSTQVDIDKVIELLNQLVPEQIVTTGGINKFMYLLKATE
jgi:hypothetical protein